MLKLKMMLCDDAAAGRRRLHYRQSVSRVKPPPPPAWIMQPRLADTKEWDYFTLRERLITMQKQLVRNSGSILMSSADRASTRWATHAIIVSNTHALPAEYKCLK